MVFSSYLINIFLTLCSPTVISSFLSRTICTGSIPANVHKLPFQFQLTPPLPESYEDNICQIDYYLEARLKRDTNTLNDYIAVQEILMLSPINLNEIILPDVTVKSVCSPFVFEMAAFILSFFPSFFRSFFLPSFLSVCGRQKTLWEKEKLLMTNGFPFSHNVSNGSFPIDINSQYGVVYVYMQ